MFLKVQRALCSPDKSLDNNEVEFLVVKKCAFNHWSKRVILILKGKKLNAQNICDLKKEFYKYSDEILLVQSCFQVTIMCAASEQEHGWVVQNYFPHYY